MLLLCLQRAPHHNASQISSCTCSQQPSLANPDGPLAVRDISPLFVFIVWFDGDVNRKELLHIKTINAEKNKENSMFKSSVTVSLRQIGHAFITLSIQSQRTNLAVNASNSNSG